MLTGSRARSERGAGNSRTRLVRVLLPGIQGATHIALAFALLACVAAQGLWAQAAPQKLIVHRSTRAIPHRFMVHPSEVTVAVNQTQRFEVTDAQGTPVPVHWNVSGIGCSGEACGTIDDEGIYRTPSALPQPRVVTVEGVLVSDPNYSVLTQVRLEDSEAANVSAPGEVATARTEPFAAPEVERQSLAKNAGLPPMADAIAAAPVVERHNFASTAAGSPPLPNVVTPAPAIGRQNLPSSAESLPLPNVVAAAPVVGRQNLASSAESLPLPNVVAAAPLVGKQVTRSAVGSPPLPDVIAAAPAVGRQNLAVSSGVLPLPNVIAAAPVVATQRLATSAGSPPLPKVVAPAPVVGRQNLANTELILVPDVVAAAPAVGRKSLSVSSSAPPLPNAIAAAPAVGRQNLATSAGSPPLPNVAPAEPVIEKHDLAVGSGPPSQPNLVAMASPAPAPFSAGKTQQLTPATVGKQKVSGVLVPMTDATASVPAEKAAAPHAPVVTYRDGQLTIDAENSTLAAVLQMIAEKTGAVIEVPPGSGLEHIFEHTGPGPVNDVLERLLNGSPFNFIIVSSAQNPNQPAQVLLSLHGPETDTPTPPTVAAAPPPSPALWTPPPVVPSATVFTPMVIEPPKEPLSPEALGELMKDKAKELREQLQRQQQQQQ
jgi:hypothetical protein